MPASLRIIKNFFNNFILIKTAHLVHVKTRLLRRMGLL